MKPHKPRLCPYNLTIEQRNQYIHEYNENGQETFQAHCLIENQKPMPCAGKPAGHGALDDAHEGGEPAGRSIL